VVLKARADLMIALTDQPQIKLWIIRPKEETFKLRRALIDRDEIYDYGIQEPSFLMFKNIIWNEDDLKILPSAGADDEDLVEVSGATS